MIKHKVQPTRKTLLIQNTLTGRYPLKISDKVTHTSSKKKKRPRPNRIFIRQKTKRVIRIADNRPKNKQTSRRQKSNEKNPARHSNMRPRGGNTYRSPPQTPKKGNSNQTAIPSSGITEQKKAGSCSRRQDKMIFQAENKTKGVWVHRG